MKKVCYIMISPSGSGKSTLAKKLVKEDRIFSTDSYFVKNGVYKFDPEKLGAYHKKNFEAFSKALEDGAPVCCDNTNLRAKDVEKYKKAAKEAGYIVVLKTGGHPAWLAYLKGSTFEFDKEEGPIKVTKDVIVDFLYESSVHGVPKEKVAEMVNGFHKVWKA